MAVATILNPDVSVEAQKKWQLLKSPTTTQTLITTNSLAKNLLGLNWAESTVEFLNVAPYGAIRFQCMGVASNNNAPVIHLYGWHATGPASHIGVVTLAFGNFSSVATTGLHALAETHKSIRDAFLPETAYRMCDTYTITNDYEQEMIVGIGGDVPTAKYEVVHKALSSPVTSTNTVPPEADVPSYVNVDFSRSRYEYFGVLVSALNSATTVGAIYVPLSIRKSC